MANRKTALRRNPSVKDTRDRKHRNRTRPVRPPPAQQQPTGPTPQGVSQDVYTRMGGFAQQFDPSQFQQQYEPQFNQQMGRAYNAVMGQFELQNQRAFEQQKKDLDQEAAMKGWDPGGANYQRRYAEMMDAQNRARQEAMNSATQQAYSVQQQGYQQATGTALLPGQIAGQYEAPYMAQYGAQLGEEAAQKQFGRTKEQMALEQKYRLQAIKATPRGGGGGGGSGYTPYDAYELSQLSAQYQQQQPQVNPWAVGAAALTQAAGDAMINQWGQPVKPSGR